jgi:protein-disulfide isomerase
MPQTDISIPSDFNKFMNLQRIVLLSVLALVFSGVATLSFYRVWNESQTRFRVGLPVPQSIVPKELLTTAEINAGGPPIAPEIRSTDPLLSGDIGSQVTIIEFGDYQSDLTKQQNQAITEALVKLNTPNLVRTVWRDLPNSAEHSKALDAAIAARCADEQGKFKAMNNLILQSAQQYDSMEFLRFARRIALKEDTFVNCINDPKWLSTVIPNDLSEATDLAITQVPTIFINGTPYEGYTDTETIYNAIKREQRLLNVKS